MVPDGQNADEDEDESEDSVQDEIEKQPLELEDMLELFREPEEPPRKGFNPMWLVFGLVVVVGGCWLAVVGVQSFVEQMTGLQGGTPKAGKSGERVPEVALTDVQADYRARCARGMTKDEIRWILQDFEKSGIAQELVPLRDISAKVLHPEPGERATIAERELLRKATLTMAKREREWFGDALAEGLMLDPGQKLEMKQRLADAYAEDAKQFDQVEAAIRRVDELVANKEEPNEQELGEISQLLGGEVRHVIMAYFSIATAQMWLGEEAYAPWNLCQLKADQLAVTNHDHVSAQHGENAEAGWLMFTPETDGGEAIRFPRFLDGTSAILPFTAKQNFPSDENDVPVEEKSIEVLTKLHPAQFKLLLLFYPELPGDLIPLLEEK